MSDWTIRIGEERPEARGELNEGQLELILSKAAERMRTCQELLRLHERDIVMWVKRCVDLGMEPSRVASYAYLDIGDVERILETGSLY
ncbi:MAG: hypothetical protein Q4G34_02675 [Micrococcus sp.]|nr:hypothetical protein [Micrococcus sp.]